MYSDTTTAPTHLGGEIVRHAGNFLRVGRNKAPVNPRNCISDKG